MKKSESMLNHLQSVNTNKIKNHIPIDHINELKVTIFSTVF